MSIILHLDMNSYFASVEQQANPILRGRPVGVCEHLGGIIIAPSVEAKRAGIKLGTPVWEALKIRPDIVLLPTDPDKYRHVTERFMKILCGYTDAVERYSIDEAFADLTGVCRDYDDALLLGLEIKQRLRREIGEWVSCSIGIGPNKLVAKIAADLDGGLLTPALSSLRRRGRKGEEMIDRICVVKPEQVHLLYERLQLTDIPGIGERMKHALNKLGIFSLRELAGYPLENLLNQFGMWGYVLRGLSQFQDMYVREELPKSVGHMYTLPRAIRGIREIRGLMMKLAEKVGRRMRKNGARGNVIHYFDTNFGRQKKLGEYINDGRQIYRAAFEIFHNPLQLPLTLRGRVPPLKVRGGEGELLPIKIMGISVSGLIFSAQGGPASGWPQELFESYKKLDWAVSAMDKINDKYGEFTLVRGRLLGVPDDWGKDTVGFGRTRS